MRRGWKIFLLCCVLLLGNVQVHAEEQMMKANTLLEVVEETELVEDIEDRTSVIGTLQAGTPVISVEDERNGWIKVSYREMTGYISTLNVSKYGDAELDQEFEQLANQNKLMMNELEYVALQKKQEMTWGIITGVLVIALFAVGIATAVVKNIHEIDKKRKKVTDKRGNK